MKAHFSFENKYQKNGLWSLPPLEDIKEMDIDSQGLLRKKKITINKGKKIIFLC